MGRVSGSTSRSSLGRDPRVVLRPSLSQPSLSLSLCFSSIPPSIFFPLAPSFRTLLSSRSCSGCLLARSCISQADRRRGDVFKSPSSMFVGKPIETVSLSLFLFRAYSGHHFGIDKWRWLTSRFFKRRTSLSSVSLSLPLFLFT